MGTSAVLVRLDPLVLRTALRLICLTSCWSGCAPKPAEPGTVGDEPTPTHVADSGTPGPISGELGTAHPLTIQAVAPSGHWLAMCQARADTDGDGRIHVSIGEHGKLYGDEMRAYLVRATGAGDPIEAFVGSDPSGRHIAVMKDGGRIVLHDTWKGSELEIPHASDDPDPFGPHRAVAFDQAGHVAWAEHDGGDWRIVVRELEGGGERRIAVGSALLWRFELDASGEWLWIWTIDDDTDVNGKVELPTERPSLSERFCRRGIGVFHGRYGDQPVRRVAPVTDGAVATLADDVLGVLGAALIVRKPDGSIVRRVDDGEHVLVPAACAGRIVHADPPTESLWVACVGQARPKLNYRVAPLHRYRFDEHEDLHREIDVADDDVWNAGKPELKTADGAYVNVTTGTVGTQSSDSGLLPIRAGLPESDDAYGPPLATAITGERLVAARSDGFGTTIEGPLRWISPLTKPE